MREMKDSGVEWIGDIPANWSILRNKNAFSCDKVIVGADSDKTQLLSLTTKGIKKKDINTAEGKLPESFDTYQRVAVDDIVMCLFDLDCSAVFSGISPYEGMISPAYRVLTCKENIVPKYADYWFRYISDGRKFNHYAKNIRYTLSYEEFSALPILMPDLDTQEHVADFLNTKCSKIDGVIVRQQEAIEKLKAYNLSVITEAVTKGLNHDVPMKDSGYSFAGCIPTHWTPMRMKNIAVAIGDGIHTTPEYDSDGDYYFLNGNNIGAEYLVFKESTDRLSALEYQKYKAPRLNGETIFITLNGATYGKTSFYHGEKVLLGKSAGYITLNGVVNKRYIRYYLQSRVARTIMELSLCGSTIANLSLKTLNNFYIPLPDRDEQDSITTYLDQRCAQIDCLISQKQSIIEKLTEYKKSLIYEVVTGKREV